MADHPTEKDVLSEVRQAAYDLGNDPPNGITTMRALTALGKAVVEIERLQARERMLLERHTGCGCDSSCPVCDELGFT
jgi:hypothetical protein